MAIVLVAWTTTSCAAPIHSSMLGKPAPILRRANYGAAYLFLDFLREHYGGDDTIRSVVSAPGEGTDAINNGLRAAGRSESFDDVFKQWALANLLDGQKGAMPPILIIPTEKFRCRSEPA